ncbi:MAG: acyl-CoA carboxylase subunit beta [Proteobacteria bacterium]|nr:acyl-CoA carboxylase subunit beta [Pseudomonadota bacterium]
MKLGGGGARLKAQNIKGKMSVWQRIEYLFDPETFVEVGGFVELRNEGFGLDKSKTPGDGVVTGFGRVNGLPVYIAAQDFTVIGGSVGEMHGKKIANIMDMAVQNGAPLIMLNDSVGARIQEGIGALCGYGDIFFRNTRASGVVPQISVIMGPCAGGAVYSPGITDFVVMVRNTSNMFVTGPDIIKTVTGEIVSKDDLGGPDIHMERSGVVTHIGEDDESTLDWVKILLSYLPSNNLEAPPILKLSENQETAGIPQENLVPSNASKPYDMFQVIESIVDSNSFLELQSGFAKNMLIGFSRLEGYTVGIVANNPKELAGCLDVDASDKAARFVRFCDAFNIPLLTLVDVPGFLPGTDQEYAGIIRHGAKLLYAYSEATVPKMTVILRKAYGGAYISMCSKHLGADIVLAWPGSQFAVMGPKGAVGIVFRNEIKNAKDPEKKALECEKDYMEKITNPKIAASLGYIDDVIEPGETRTTILLHLSALLGKRVEMPKRKHGNIPL